MEPIGRVRARRSGPTDDDWGGTEAAIVLAESFDASALAGIEEFTHVEVVYCFDRVDPAAVARGSRRPRGNPTWPEVGIFAQRGKERPNRIGTTIVRIVRREERTLVVAELDAIDGTPVLDIKPVMKGFLPRGPVREPEWAEELMRDYWKVPEER